MELLERFAAGDPEAFEAQFRRHQHEVYGWVIGIVRDPGAAEDLVLETLWRIHRAHCRFDPSNRFGAWARRIATNAALDHLKRQRQEAPLAEGWRECPPDQPVSDSRMHRQLRCG